MSRRMRRVTAAVVGTLTIVLVAAWMLYASHALSRYIWAHVSLNIPVSQAGGPRPDTYDRAAHPFYIISIGALLLTAGGSAALLLLLPRAGFRARAWIYFAFLVIVLPATWYNYNQGDNVLRAGLQAGMNVVLIFLASSTAIWLNDAPADSPDTRVLKYLSLALLLLAGVFVPGFFSIVWLFYTGGLLTLKQSREITFAHITGAASVASAVIAWLNYRREQAKLNVEKRQKSILI